MASEKDKSHRFGFKPPSRRVYIKEKLEQYSDGQIIKELIQNAEDAGAQTVKFMYDATQYGRNSVYSDALARHQGPALFSYNDAIFNEWDWEAIQHPACSSKATDPLKVGRFGIGFTSVYHITDLPSIVSDGTIAFIDPLEEHFRDSAGYRTDGWRFDLANDSEEFTNSKRYTDQFKPYRSVFPDVGDGIANQHLDGTLFRFPLRQTPSDLSEKTYTASAEVEDLFEAFKAEADVVLLFLRSLESVELRKQEPRQKSILVVKATARSESIIKQTIESKQDFTERLTSYCSGGENSPQNIDLTQHVTIAYESADGSATCKEQSWIVSHSVAGNSESEEILEMAENQKVLPWTGVAIPLGDAAAGDRPQELVGSGRVFCFLPLPPGEESNTGLPVHIHGFFAINSDRRGIKWPGPDRNDTSADWNQRLVSELLPVVYVRAILHAIDMNKDQKGVPVQSIYAAWPQEENVLGIWTVLLDPFFKKLFAESAIHSENRGWTSISNVSFNELDVSREMERAILKCVREADEPWATVPKECMQSIRNFYTGPVRTITSSLLCRCLRENPCILEALTSDEKLLILEFILMKDSYEDLQGLSLLPLENGEFIAFNASENAVFAPTATFRRELVPGANQHFVRGTPDGSLLYERLNKLAETQRYQLQFLTSEAVAELLKDHLQTWLDEVSQTGRTHASSNTHHDLLKEWLDCMWTMLYKECKHTLTLFEEIPIVPLADTDGNIYGTAPLSSTNAIIQRKHNAKTLVDDLEDILCSLGVTITSCPSFVLDHPAVLRGGYIHEPTPNGVIRALLAVNESSLKRSILSLSNTEKEVMKMFLSKAILDEGMILFLRDLPLFKPLAGTGTADMHTSVCVEGSRGYVDCEENDIPQPLSLSSTLIDGREDGSRLLLGKLGVKDVSKYGLIVEIVTEIESDHSCTLENRQQVLRWILSRWVDVKSKCKSVESTLQNMKFIPSYDAHLSPLDLFDPTDPILRQLFSEEHFFPVAPFCDTHILQALRVLGMRSHHDLKVEEAILCIDAVEEANNRDKAYALLQLLSSSLELLEKTSPVHHCTIARYMYNKRCIPYRENAMDYYPSDFSWYTNSTASLSFPNETLMETKKSVLVSAAIVPFAEQKFSTVFEKLGMKSNRPSLSNIIQQLDRCVSRVEEHGDASLSVESMIWEIYSFLLQAWRENASVTEEVLSKIPNCIWNGSTFSEPGRLCTDDLLFDLSPYMGSIPKGFRTFSSLFTALGVKSNINTDAEALVGILHDIQQCCNLKNADHTFQTKQRRLVVEILHQLSHAYEHLPDEVNSKLLVPAHGSECHLIPIAKGAYVDMDWLKYGTNTDIDDEEDFTRIHDDIPVSLAKFLQVSPLSRFLLNAEDLGFTQSGQYEPLTVRISNILKNTYEDTAIYKEMIQNAEDAGAQEVRFLIDMRENNSATTQLFDPGMKACHGPSLWVFNDAVFTDEDFVNILRLGGRTKEKESDKIGRFGIGFNSVYHLTDAPCFVSRQYIQYFDPHTTYLGNILRDKSQPGIRVKLDGNKQIRRFSDQFKPFDGVFGLKLSQEFDYKGTLFRLPLRSKEVAHKSEICRESYDEARLAKLLLHMWKSSQDLLLFTKNVRKVTVCFLPGTSTDASTETVELFSFEKNNPHQKSDEGISVSCDEFYQNMTAEGAKYFGNDIQKPNNHCSTMTVTYEGSQRAKNEARLGGADLGLSPKGAVCIPFVPPKCHEYRGKIHCYLPLPLDSLLPVHINGSFAITDDRRNIHKPSPDPDLDFQSRWNYILLSDVICRAYITLLMDKSFVDKVKANGAETIELFWPDVYEVSKTSQCAPLFDAFYEAIVNGFDDDGKKPAVFWKNDVAYRYDQVIFTSQDVQRSSVKEVFHDVLQSYVGSSLQVIHISEKTQKAFERIGLQSDILQKTFDFNRFFDEVFAPSLSRTSPKQRDSLVLFALKSELKLKLKDIACIPVEGHQCLRKASELVHPKGMAAPMFSSSDGKFPQGKEFNTSHALQALVDIGMVVDVISPDILIDRCESIKTLPLKAAENRCSAVLKYMSDPSRGRWNEEENTALKDKLKTVAFLPVLCEDKYQDAHLPWKSNGKHRFSSANDIYPKSHRHLVSGVSLILDEASTWSGIVHVKKFLGIDRRRPTIDEVLQQLTLLTNNFEMTSPTAEQPNLAKTCSQIYKYFDEECAKSCPSDLQNTLKTKPCFLIKDQFVEASKLALNGKDLPPYLLVVPRELKQLPHLLECAKVKDTFEQNDYEGTLQDIYTEFHSRHLDDETMQVVLMAAQRLSEFTEDVPPTFLPDMDSIMRPTSQLCYCDVKWVVCEENLYQCHEHISFSLAKKLKVKDVRHQMLENHTLDFGETFGQHEKLRSRIKRILDSYPSDETILKELLQNADDAGATEIHFVYDTRTHSHEKIMGDDMRCLQGPALCVFNDRSFSDEDLRGIQNLGEGSKAIDIGKIGRYGVGFNSVYQLTDCPSFISSGEKLCFFDPLLNHVPGASLESPGRLFKINQKLRQTFPDVFACYLEDTIPKDDCNFTMFRFPLRANSSELSDNIWSPESIRDMLGAFEECAFESLLFLKNITKIRISEMDARGRIRRDRTVSANYSPEEEEKRASLNKHIRNFAKMTQEGGNVSDWKPEQVTYRVNIDGGKRHERWVVTQQVGFDEEYETDGHLLKRQKLIPLGGVAARLPGTKGQEKVKGKSFCFLPLPLDTGLPLHVNGYFALDHESRRHLWESQHEDERSRWNRVIIGKIIAPCYVNLLLWIRDFFIQEYRWTDSVSTSMINQTRSHLLQYHNYFPRGSEGGYWTHLVDSVYIGIAKCKHSLFPHLEMSESFDDFLIEWKTPVPSDNPSKRGYFFNPAVETRNVLNVSQSQTKKKTLKKVLLQVRFPLIESPFWIMENLSTALKTNNATGDIGQIFQVSPENVIPYLRGENPLNTQLPMPISQTRLRDIDSLSLLIDFCKQSSIQLDGLPLLLTQDGILREFSREAPVFVSEYGHLFVASSERFIHKRFLLKFRNLIHVKDGMNEKVLKKINIHALPSLLKESTPFLETVDDDCKPLDKRLSCEWFQDLWKLIASIPKFDENEIKRNLNQWAILPVVPVSGKGGIVRLAPMSIACTILPSDYHQIGDALKALEVNTVHTALFREDKHVLQLVCRLVAQVSDHRGVLRILTYWTAKDEARFMRLSPRLKFEILQYFSNCKDKDTLDGLKSVPCFQTIDGKFINIRYSDTVLVLPSKIPQIEQYIWMVNTNAIFLQYYPSLYSLYERLGLTNSTEAYVYMTFIFPQFGHFTQSSRMAHLLHVKEMLSTVGDDSSAKAVKACLRQLPFVLDSSGIKLRKASELFDPEKEIFALMLTREDFPPDEVRMKLGLPFLRDIGLQTKLTREQFIQFAHQIERSHSNTRQTNNISKLLIEDLKENCLLHSDWFLLQEIRAIRFLVASGVGRELESIHKSKATPGCLTMYSGSTVSKCELNWSTECALPTYARISPDTCSSCVTDFYSHLNVKTDPDFSSVMKHLQTICNETQQRPKRNRMILYAKKYKKVLMAIFAYLDTQCSNGKCQKSLCAQCTVIQRELNHVAIVFLDREDEHILVRADQISRTITATENLEPFVYQIQDCWGPYIRLFFVLGATSTPTISQFSFVLERLFQTQEQDVLRMNPNASKLIETAVRGLLGRIAESDAESVHGQLGNSLYLPSTKGVLKRSNELYLNNSGLFKKRLTNCPLPLVHIFEGLENIIERVLQHLPVDFRPKTIDECVKEVLSVPRDDADSCEICPDMNCAFRKDLTTILHSRELVIALTCLMANNKQAVDESNKQRIANRLSQFGVTCMQRVRTVLKTVNDNVDIEHSENDVTSFVEGDRELVVQHSNGEDRMLIFSDVALKLDQVLKTNLEGKALMALSNVLSQSSPDKFPSIIKHFGFDHTLMEALTCGFQLPPPGSTVPDEISHLIEQDPWISFREGEYVAYSRHTDGFYVYARIVEHVRGDSIRAVYLIDVGLEEHIEASVVDIHKIQIPIPLTGGVLIRSDRIASNSVEQECTQFPIDVEEAKKQITAELEEIWTLPEDQRKQAIRRLLLKWHPDKHPEGPSDFFNESFKHLKSEIIRLQSGLGRHREGTGFQSRGASSGSSRFYYDDLFREADERARTDRSRYNKHGGFTNGRWNSRTSHRHGGFTNGWWNSRTSHKDFSYFFTSAPDHRNARRWFRQAQEDLRAAHHDLCPNDEPSFEWVAFKCHQAVEKSLKAAELAIRGSYQSTHSISSLANSVSGRISDSVSFMGNISSFLRIVNDDEKSCYPDRCAFSQIPHEVFCDASNAQRAIELSNSILDSVKVLIGFAQ